ncbi:hypothetical protein [Candidatus Protochlamydia phocaeensis]|uniref:hypothetical protein n=1 Tax=Candidatus Protochlamydia phocaeensis TaxID=1414722 RepID=UPI000837EDC1|nr:hypothetical protein [Candidatus Protochlamydia phocaeensis]
MFPSASKDIAINLAIPKLNLQFVEDQKNVESGEPSSETCHMGRIWHLSRNRQLSYVEKPMDIESIKHALESKYLPEVKTLNEQEVRKLNVFLKELAKNLLNLKKKDLIEEQGEKSASEKSLPISPRVDTPRSHRTPRSSQMTTGQSSDSLMLSPRIGFLHSFKQLLSPRSKTAMNLSALIQTVWGQFSSQFPTHVPLRDSFSISSQDFKVLFKAHLRRGFDEYSIDDLNRLAEALQTEYPTSISLEANQAIASKEDMIQVIKDALAEVLKDYQVFCDKAAKTLLDSNYLFGAEDFSEDDTFCPVVKSKLLAELETFTVKKGEFGIGFLMQVKKFEEEADVNQALDQLDLLCQTYFNSQSAKEMNVDRYISKPILDALNQLKQQQQQGNQLVIPPNLLHSAKVHVIHNLKDNFLASLDSRSFTRTAYWKELCQELFANAPSK